VLRKHETVLDDTPNKTVQGSHRTGHAFAFVATCPSCKRAQLQNAFTRRSLEKLLNGGYPIEGYCTGCDEFWAISIQKRVEIIETIAMTAQVS
jgi:hypothetical protein